MRRFRWLFVGVLLFGGGCHVTIDRSNDVDVEVPDEGEGGTENPVDRPDDDPVVEPDDGCTEGPYRLSIKQDDNDSSAATFTLETVGGSEVANLDGFETEVDRTVFMGIILVTEIKLPDGSWFVDGVFEMTEVSTRLVFDQPQPAQYRAGFLKFVDCDDLENTPPKQSFSVPF